MEEFYVLGKTASGIEWGNDPEGNMVISKCTVCGNPWTIKKGTKQYDYYVGELTSLRVSENRCPACFRKSQDDVPLPPEPYPDRDKIRAYGAMLGQAEKQALDIMLCLCEGDTRTDDIWWDSYKLLAQKFFETNQELQNKLIK